MSAWLVPVVVFYVIGVLVIVTVATCAYVGSESSPTGSPADERAKARHWMILAPFWPIVLVGLWARILIGEGGDGRG